MKIILASFSAYVIFSIAGRNEANGREKEKQMDIEECIAALEEGVAEKDKQAFWNGFVIAAKVVNQETKAELSNEEIAIELAYIATAALARWQ